MAQLSCKKGQEVQEHARGVSRMQHDYMYGVWGICMGVHLLQADDIILWAESGLGYWHAAGLNTADRILTVMGQCHEHLPQA